MQAAPRYNSQSIQGPSQSGIPLDFPIDAELEIRGSSNSEALPLHSFPFPELTTLNSEQVDFCIGQFKACVLQLVQQNNSPFVHSLSYQHTPPNLYQDLLGVSAMYSQKTPQNQTIVFAMLDNRISTLVASSNSSAWSMEDTLVNVQALVVYQIIRLFDGDIRQRANAERHFPMLDTWTCQLRTLANNLMNDNLMTHWSLYERWVFIESSRRTVMMSVMVQAVYAVAKEGVCSLVPFLATLPISVNGVLWKMSEEEWWQCTLGLGSDLLTYQEFMNEWDRGTTFQTDAFETILLVACKHKLGHRPFLPTQHLS